LQPAQAEGVARRGRPKEGDYDVDLSRKPQGVGRRVVAFEKPTLTKAEILNWRVKTGTGGGGGGGLRLAPARTLLVKESSLDPKTLSVSSL